MADRAVEEVLAEELRLAKIDFDAAMENHDRSASEITTAVDAYALALFRFSISVNNRTVHPYLVK